MEPTNLRFGGGSAETMLHPLVALVTLGCIILVFVLPRRYALLPFLSAIFLVPFGQVLVVGGVHFTVYRFLVTFALVRVMLTRSAREADSAVVGINAIDWAFGLCALSSAAAFTLLWMDPQALIKEAGTLLDAMGGYVVIRFFLRDIDDVQRSIRLMTGIALALAVSMTGEQLTSCNLFGLLGGVPILSTMREGHIRSQGTFEVYITAGVFGATFLPLLAGVWKSEERRWVVVIGIAAATAITICSYSSTPLLAYVAGVIALYLWRVRDHMRALRWLLLLGLISLHLIMKAPVWALVARIDLTGSSSGYHRYMLVDNFIRHFGDWWLLGVKDYNNWGWDMWDLSNQYVAYGLTGGLVTLVFFIAVICRAFSALGQARRQVAGQQGHEWLLWCLGAALFSHVVAYFGIGYFDQIQVAWYLILSMICATVASMEQQLQGCDNSEVEECPAPLASAV
jgi:hypothetical protein